MADQVINGITVNQNSTFSYILKAAYNTLSPAPARVLELRMTPYSTPWLWSQSASTVTVSLALHQAEADGLPQINWNKPGNAVILNTALGSKVRTNVDMTELATEQRTDIISYLSTLDSDQATFDMVVVNGPPWLRIFTLRQFGAQAKCMVVCHTETSRFNYRFYKPTEVTNKYSMRCFRRYTDLYVRQSVTFNVTTFKAAVASALATDFGVSVNPLWTDGVINP